MKNIKLINLRLFILVFSHILIIPCESIPDRDSGVVVHHRKDPSERYDRLGEYTESSEEQSSSSATETNKGEIMRCGYCTFAECKPTVTPSANFKPLDDSKAIYKQINYGVHNLKAVSDILTKRSENQREKILTEYTRLGSPLLRDIVESMAAPDVKDFLLALATPLPVFYAQQLKDAITSGNTDVMVEILTSLPGCATREVSTTYEIMYSSPLSADVGSKAWFQFHKFLTQISFGYKDWSMIEREYDTYVEKLSKANHEQFTEIVTSYNITKLRAVIEKYRRKIAENIEDTINDNFKDKLKSGYLTLVKQVRNQPRYFAGELGNALVNKDIKKLTRILRGRSGIDLRNIQQDYDEMHDGTLVKHIKKYIDDADLRVLLIAILNV